MSQKQLLIFSLLNSVLFTFGMFVGYNMEKPKPISPLGASVEKLNCTVTNDFEVLTLECER